MHVLLIDNSRAHRLIAQRALIELGCSVTESEDASEAARWLKGGTKVDLVLVDCEMPSIDGLEFVRGLRAGPETAGVPIILLGTTKYHDRLSEALEAGANEYIIKPCTKDVLAMKLEMLGIETA